MHIRKNDLSIRGIVQIKRGGLFFVDLPKQRLDTWGLGWS